ncbi:MAG: adenylosuccinate synthase [Candidatus Marinimicrobia bacterium]|jgi:adenylosuccinate synthase|nr:adenylosuccinate synthase [Candidatus Neomarinimicrobiota bacterium]
MSVSIVMGAQWGDEGKGKIVDTLAEKADMVIRYQGGANAGHTVIHGTDKYVLHLIPSGIISGKSVNIIGNGCVVDPVLLLQEIDTLQNQGITVDPRHLMIAENAHIVTPLHKWLDSLQNAHIGTTKRGIGPAYEQKARRNGIRFDMIAGDRYQSILDSQIAEIQKVTETVYHKEFPDNMEDELNECFRSAQKLLPFVKETASVIAQAVTLGKEILYEGAQGTLLDIDHGTYPFVTSSSTTIGGAYTGSGVYVHFDRRIGIVKSYTTRVGEGPFPTELFDKDGDKLRQNGHEFGATTGRPRRCGWLDLPLLKKAIRINGFNSLVLTKISCLSGFDTLKIAVDYHGNQPIYQELAGWQKPVEGVTDWNALPKNCQYYVQFIEETLGVPFGMISTGPDRDNIIVRHTSANDTPRR